MTVFSISPHEEFRILQIFICEFIGSLIMMCLGCLASYAGPAHYTDLAPLQSGIAWGLLVCTISLAIGYVSGAQCNSCITLCFVILGRMSLLDALTYATAQLLGCFVGIGLAVVLVPEALHRDYKMQDHCGFCTTRPSPDLSVIQVFVLEFWATFLLVLCVCGASDPRTADAKDIYPLMFSFLISMLVFVVGPFTGASLNPFRTLAPAVFSNCWDAHYMYWFGPLGGSASASILYKYILQDLHRSP